MELSRRQSVTVALLGDTHGHLDERIAAVVQRCDAAAHTGDIGSAALLEQLAPRLKIVEAVRGNSDTSARWPGNAGRILARLPEVATLDLPGGRLIVVHGDRYGAPKRRHQRLRATFPEARGIACGHSHRLICDRDTIPWILNPGAAGRTRTYGGPSCLILTATADEWRVVARRFVPVTRRS